MKTNKIAFIGTLAAAAIMTSCIQITDELDTSKGIKYDMQLAADGFAIPLGDMDTIFTDSIIKVEKDDPDASIQLNDKDIYVIQKSGEIKGISVDIDDMSINIEDPQIDPIITHFEVLAPAGIEIPIPTFTTDINSEATISIDNEIDKSVCELWSVSPKEKADVLIRFDVAGMPGSVEDMKLENFAITLPDFIIAEYTGSDARVTYDESKNTVYVNGTLNKDEIRDGGSGFVINGIAIKELRFASNPVVEKYGQKRCYIPDASIQFGGKTVVENSIVNTNDLKDVIITPIVSIAEMSIGTINAKINPEIDPVSKNISLSLDDDLDFLKEEDNELKLNTIEMKLNLTSTIPANIVLDIEMSSSDKNGKFICQGLKPDFGPVTIPACPENLEEKSYTLLIYNDADRHLSNSSDTIYAKLEKLPELVSRIPDSVMVNITPGVDQSRSYTINLDRTFRVEPKYDVCIPMSFKSIDICYNDTIKDLKSDLKDISKYLINAKAEIQAEIESTLPVGIVVNATALDSDGNKVNGITFHEVAVPAGSEKEPAMTGVRIQADIEDGALESLDAIALNISGISDDSGSVKTLKSTEYVLVKDAKLFFNEGIEADFSELID